MVNRVTLTLDQPEYSALLEVAGRELRNPADQARYMLRRDLEGLGLLVPEQPCKDSGQAEREGVRP